MAERGRSDGRRKVLFLNHAGHVSGAEVSLSHLAKALLSHPGWHPVVAAPEEGRMRGLFESVGLTMQLLPVRPPGRNPWSNLANARILGRFVARENISIVHANSFHAAKAIFLFTRFSRIPVVVSVRDIQPFPRLTTMSLAACAATVCVSKATANNLIHRFPRRRRDRIHVIYNGIEPALYRRPGAPEEVFSRLGVGNVNRPVVTMLAPIVRWKGQDVFLRAAQEFVGQTGCGTFLLVGHEDFADDAYVKDLRTLAQAPQLKGRVTFTGFREDVPEILAVTDLVVCPSVAPDPFPRAVIEAMAAACPVIGSRTGGIPEAVVDGKTGVLVSPGDASAIARAMVELVENAERARAMGRLGAELVHQRFSTAVHVENMTTLYEEILGMGGRSQ